MEFDCRACGACCLELDVLLGEEEAVQFAARTELAALTIVHQGPSGPPLRLMRKIGERCAALVGPLDNCRCCIYAQRPGLCREMEPGSEYCLAARQRMLVTA
jgi:uncharacterized protein